jgi:hypothetical protein
MSEQPTDRGGLIYWMKRRSHRFWITAVALLPVLYIASFGPACWWLSPKSAVSGGIAIRQVPCIYWPIGRVLKHAPRPIADAICQYATLRLGEDVVYCGQDDSGYPVYFSRSKLLAL